MMMVKMMMLMLMVAVVVARGREADVNDDGKGKKGKKQIQRTAALVRRATFMTPKSTRWNYYAKRGMQTATTSDF
jgi:hypothetical protein